MRVLIAFLLLISYVFAATTITFTAKKDHVVNAGEFAARRIDKYFGLIFGFYSSVEVSGSGTNTSGTVAANIVAMGVHVGVPNLFSHAPFSWMANIKGNASFSITNLNASLNADVAAAVIITAHSHIQERTPAGAVVKTKYLKDYYFSGEAGTTTDGKVSFLSFKSIDIPIIKDESIELLYFVSEELGEVTIGTITTTATPKTLESVVIITDWQYASKSNYLVIVSGVATGAITANVDLSAKATLSSGVGNDKVYAYFSDVAEIDGTIKSVTVKTSSAGAVSAAIDNTVFQGHLNGIYKGGASAQIVEVSFENSPGAAKIVYDPTLGAGSPVMENGVSRIVFFAVAYLLALLM